MSSLVVIQNTFKRIFDYDDATPLADILRDYRRLEKEYQLNQKSMDICSPYGTIFSMAVLTLLSKLRQLIHSDESILEGIGGLPPQIIQTLNDIRLNYKPPGTLLWFEETSPVWKSYNPLNWQDRLDAEYDPGGDDFFEARDLLASEMCDPVEWQYRREVIPAAIFKHTLPELQASFISDLRNLFGFSYYYHVVVLARSALESSLKEKLGQDFANLGDDKKRGTDGLVSLYARQSKCSSQIVKYMNYIRLEGNNAVHSLVRMKKLRGQEKTAYEIIVKLIFCMEDIYK